ncbi:MAG: ribonuclease E/G [Hydrogenophilales bacterium 17-61-9]|nr:MAG: ribonuclease E/G [Hydrogenophilales bacterium 17-61-9]
MKRMLFNATQAEELRVAIVDGQKLVDLDIESASKEQRKGNVYKGIVTRVEPSLEAAFVDYGCERHGFLPFKEISRASLPGNGRPQDALKEGQELLVQVEKDERGNKGAALTTYVSLAGRYVVLMPTNPRGGGVSRRIEGEDRNELRDTLAQLEIPEGMSLIARTAGIGRTAEEFQWDLNYLLSLWKAIDGASTSQTGTFLIYQEGSLVIRAIRDYFSADIGEILIDTDDIFEQAQQFMAHVMPDNVSKVKLYHDDVPLFSRFQIEHQIESAYSRQVNLPSGGAIVIDHTEALVSVDVNSARATKGSDVEQTAYNTNLEASDEIARQMRLRDLGGLIVIDYIDMENPKNQREVENRLRDALHHDRARVQTGKISRFGLLEMSRQRLQPSLGETSYTPCPRCHGTGHIRGSESSALHILRILGEEAMKENTGAVHVQLPVDVATFLLNEKRVDIHTIETRLKVNVVLIPNIHMETPHYTITRLRHDELNLRDAAEPSYKMVALPEADSGYQAEPAPLPVRQEAAVKSIAPAQPAPSARPLVPAAPQAEAGLFGRIFGWFKSRTDDAAATPAATPTPARRERTSENRDRKPGQRRGRGEGRNAEGRGEGRGEGRNDARPQAARQAEPRQKDNRAEGANAESARPPRQPRQPKPRPEAESAPQAAVLVDAPREAGSEEKREPRSRRGRGNRRPRDARPETAGEEAQQAALETGAPAAFHGTVEIAGAPKAAPAPVQPTQQAFQLDAAHTPSAQAPAASPANTVNLQQVETRGAAANTTEAGESSRPRRRRRPAAKPEAEAVSLMQVETSAPVARVSETAVADAPHPTRRRARPPVSTTQEPLIQVETQDK